MKHLILTSTSAVKVQAVKEVFPDYEIIGIKTPTVVEQPFGFLETRKYCRDRIYSVQEILGLEDCGILTISIESGLIEVIGGYADFVYVYAERDYGDWAEGIKGDNLVIPKEYQMYVDVAKELDFKVTTFGQVLNSHHPEFPKDNWQEHLCGISRKDQIKQVLELTKALL